MERFGTEYGGWDIPINNEFDENSIIYSGGVGEDMSFDLKLNNRYNCNIILIDPTQRAIKHYENLQKYYNNEEVTFTGIQKDYIENIKNLKPNFNKFTYINLGLYNKKDTLKFYKQNNTNYVSQSLIPNMFGNNYDVVNVDTIKNLMNKLGHTRIDLLKLDIEGAEVLVLEQMLDDKIFPKYLCVEFDLMLKNKDPNNLTQKLIEKLQKIGYIILINNNLNVTFKYIKNE